MGLIIDTGVVIPWAAGAAVIGWIVNELRKDYSNLKTEVKGKQTVSECDRRQDEKKETRIQISEAVRASREAREDK